MIEGLMNRTEVSKVFGVCKETISRWAKVGLIPKPLCIGGRRLFWKESEINETKDKILNNRKE